MSKKSFTLTKGKMMAFSALLFSVGVATSATSTLAYFNLNKVGDVTNLNLSINSEEAYLKLWLSKDKTKPLDELEEGKNLIYHNDGYSKEDLGIEGVVLNDVSGMNQNDWYHNGEALNDPIALPKLSTAPRLYRDYRSPGYSDLDVYVQNVFYLESNYDCSIYLDGRSPDESEELSSSYTFIRSNHDQNVKTANEKNLNVDKLDEVVHAVRVSFLTEDGYIIANPGEDEDTYYAGILDTDVDGYYDEDNNKEILYGEYEGDVSYSLDLENKEKYEGGNVFVSNHKPGVEKVNLSSVNRKKEEAVKLDSLKLDTKREPFKEVQPICTLNKGEKKRIVVTIYVEGWDKHMTDDICYASFDVALAFTALLDR